MFKPLIALIFGLVLPPLAAAVTPEQLVSPQPNSVLDQAGLLDAAQEAEIDRLSASLQAADIGELKVVTLRSVGGADPRDFATRVFNHWGIGDAERHDGLLILVAIDDRAAEIILGDGIDSDAEVAVSDRIMQGSMLPAFRRGAPAEAVLAGARALVAARLPAVEAPARLAAVEPVAPTLERDEAAADAANGRLGRLPPTDRSERESVPMPLLVTGGALLTFMGGFGGMAYLSQRARRCRACNGEMQRLDEAADDAHLSPAERSEESVHSVDYDIWICGHCGEVAKQRYGAWFSRYSACGQCKAKTASSTTTTVTAASYTSGGQVRVDTRCTHCGFHQVSHRSTPKLTRSTSRSRSSSSSRSSGGRSSGRGSSGRW